MTDQEFEELAALWNEPSDEEQAQFEAMARKARLRGKLLAWADYAWFVLLVGGFAFAALVAPGPLTMAGAVFLVISITWLTWRRREYRHIARTLDTSDRASFLESSKRVARANLRRVTLSIAAFLVLVPIALVLRISFRVGGRAEDLPAALAAWATSLRGIAVLTGLVLVLAYTIRSRMRIQAELRRLEDIRRAEEEEAMLEAAEQDKSTTFS